MGISKSIKGLFMKKKSKLDVESSSTDSGIKSPKTKPKRRQSKVYEAKNALVSTQAAGRPKYGAYNEANAKLVTAEGNYPSNYEHYSGFEPRKTKKMGILKGANMEQNGLDGSIPGGLSNMQKMNLSQVGFRTGLPQLNTAESFSDVNSCYENFYNFNQFNRNKGPMRTNSMSDMSFVGMPNTANYQRQMQLPPQPRRPTSRQSVMSGSHSSLMSSNYMPIYPNPQFAPFRQPSMTSLGQVQQQQQPEWQDAMVKMEHCLAMLNSLQMTPNQMTQMPNQMPMMSQQQQPPQQQMVQQQPMLRSIPPFRPTVNQVQRSRSGKVLQPQPDFQERELRKKRRLRKKSDLSKFDMSDLKKKLDVISQEEKEDSDNSLTSQDSKNSAKTSDGGYYGESIGNSDSNSGVSTPDKEKSDNSGDETSDSGVQTPPPELVSDQDDKPVKAELLSALDELRSQTKRTRTRSQ